MNHEELREKVADELTGCPIWENTANIGSEDAWGIADRVIRTVLTAVADDLTNEAHRPGDAWSPSQRTGITYAANRVRALIEEGKNK